MAGTSGVAYDPRRWAPLFGLLIVYALIFAGLALDVMARVWEWRFRFESPVDAAVLLYFEGIRTFVIIGALIVATVAFLRAGRHPALGWLGLGVALLAVAYGKASGFNAFPGAAQHDMAVALRGAGVPGWLMSLTFGRAEWAAWLALPLLMAFAMNYPRPLSPDDVTYRPDTARTGTLRGVALAGVDIGAVARTATAWLLRRGWLSGWRLAALGLVPAVAHTVLLLRWPPSAHGAVNGIALVAALLLTAPLIALVRAAALAAAPAGRSLVRWLLLGTGAGLALFGLSAFIGFVAPGSFAGAVAFTLAPVAVVAAFMVAVIQPLGDPAPAGDDSGGLADVEAGDDGGGLADTEAGDAQAGGSTRSAVQRGSSAAQTYGSVTN